MDYSFAKSDSPTIWDRRFMRMAEHVAHWSKDPRHKVGAVIVDCDNRIVSTGFNGFARGVVDNPHRYLDDGLKHQMIIHAEMNAILSATVDLAGCTIYGWPFPPCAPCAAAIIQSGISKVVYSPAGLTEDIVKRYGSSFGIARGMYQEAIVEVMEI